MKKLFSLLVGLLLFGMGTYAQDIQLNPGWNAVSTPAYLSNLTFSNGGEGISFITLNGGSWTSVPATVENIKPLDGFMVYNANNSTVTLTLDYKANPTPAESIWQKHLDRGWNLLGITTTDNPFKGIDATMFVDPTLGGRYTVSNGISNPELGEAYFVFVSDGSIYGGVSINETTTTNIESQDEGNQLQSNDQPQNNDQALEIVRANGTQEEKTVTNTNHINIAEFNIKSSTPLLVDSLTLQMITGNKINDTAGASIRVNGDPISNFDIVDGNIIISGLGEQTTTKNTLITIVSKKALPIGLTKYKLTEVNGQSVDMDFILNVI